MVREDYCAINYAIFSGLINFTVQGLQILLMSGVSVTSASQILESFCNIWSQASQRKMPFSDFPACGPGMYMLWFNFILGLNFNFLCFTLITIHCHTPKQRKIKYKPRIKLNHNIYTIMRDT